ncbi:MAG: carboxypeptidase regulatory-like domain-containing protein [Myxococcaceae bacterium]|nr:carboxypeptidase regulatory-like domain-containing protein [Myxococcaceae bacterium]MCI0671855.1 carboxypeptidase regulatory-like domain-containing protein [Myxococcaceae bacterium]
MFAACSEPGPGTTPDAGPQVGSLTGIVHLEGAGSHEGVAIKLTGHPVETTTAADGSFTLDDLAPGPYEVNAGKAGYVPMKATVVVYGGQTASVQLTLAGQRQDVTGKVTLTGVSNHGGVTVSLSELGATATTDAEGLYTLQNVPVGSHTVVAKKEGWKDGQANVTVAANAASTVNLTLEPVDASQGSWREGFLLPGATGNGAQVRALAKGPDGRVYAGGDFLDVGGVAARNVAVWNGTRWEALGEGLPGMVYTLAFGPDGKLYAGGDLGGWFSPNQVAVWDGTTWSYLPGTFSPDYVTSFSNLVRGLAFQGNTLIVAGDFSHVDVDQVGGLASFDVVNGTAFTPFYGSGTDGVVAAIHVEDAQRVCVGGSFSQVAGVPAANVACWDGSAWSQLGDGLPGAVSVLTRDPAGNYLAGGTLYYSIDYQTGAIRAGLAILMRGTWSSLAGGVDGGYINEVRALAFAKDGSLLVGGHFNQVGKGPQQATLARHFARLSGTAWSEVGGGLSNDVSVFLPSIIGVHDLLVTDDGEVFIAGVFSEAGGTPVANIARLDGATIHPLVPPGSRAEGVNGIGADMVLDAQGRVVLGGRFARAGGAQANNVARLAADGSWEALGLGLNADVQALLRRSDGTLVAAGFFSMSGETEAPFLATFDGTSWSAFTPPLDGPVFALAEDAEGNLYLGGDFLNAGGVVVNRVVRWDGTAFHPLLDGLANTVKTLAIDAEGHLVAGGTFTHAGLVPARGVARWSGEAWEPLGQGLDLNTWGYMSGTVNRLVTTDEGKLMVAGTFDSISGKSIRNLALWDGQEFQAMGPPVVDPQTDFALITDVVPYGKGYFVSGAFRHLGDDTVNNLAWFDGERFHALAGGLNDMPLKLLISGNTLYAAGLFTRAGGTPSSGFAVWEFGQ